MSNTSVIGVHAKPECLSLDAVLMNTHGFTPAMQPKHWTARLTACQMETDVGIYKVILVTPPGTSVVPMQQP